MILKTAFKIGERVYLNIPNSEFVGIVAGYVIYSTHTEYQVRTENGLTQLEESSLSNERVIV